MSAPPRIVTRLAALGFGAIALHCYLGSIAQACRVTCLVNRKWERTQYQIPPLPRSWKNRSQLRSKNGAPTLMVEDRKEQMRGWQAVLPQRLKPGNLWQLPQT